MSPLYYIYNIYICSISLSFPQHENLVGVNISLSTMKVLFGNLANSLVISYNAKAIDGQLCLEASPAENDSCFVHSPHATMLEVM